MRVQLIPTLDVYGVFLTLIHDGAGGFTLWRDLPVVSPIPVEADLLSGPGNTVHLAVTRTGQVSLETKLDFVAYDSCRIRGYSPEGSEIVINMPAQTVTCGEFTGPMPTVIGIPDPVYFLLLTDGVSKLVLAAGGDLLLEQT